MVDYQYYEIDLYGKYFANIPKTIGVLAKIWFTMEKLSWSFGGKKNPMILNQKLWYYTENTALKWLKYCR